MATLVEWLIDELDADLSRRRREAIDLRLMVRSAAGTREAMLTRACQVMAYAHWEGFVKTSLRLYLEHLVRLRLDLATLRYELQALALMPKIRAAVAPERSVRLATQMLVEVDGRSGTAFDVRPSDVVRVGNMTAENFETLLGLAGLAYLPTYATRAQYIDSVVCGRRHRVAHGEWQPVSSTEAEAVVTDVVDLCVQLNDQIQTAAVYQEYRL